MGYIDKVVKYKYNGQSLASYCRQNKISYDSVRSKIKSGMPIDQAIQETHKKYIKYDEVKDLSPIAEEYRIRYKNADLSERTKLKREFFKLDAKEYILDKYWEKIVFNKKISVSEQEIWKQTKEHEKYQVSNLGRFRKVNETSTARYSPVKPFLHSKRSRKTSPRRKILCVKLGSKEYSAKKVVANSFVDNPNNYTCVMQIDNNIMNLNAKNLKWISASQYGKLTGYKSKSMPVKVIYDLENEKIYRSARYCAKQLGISYQTVLDYCHNKVRNPKYKIEFEKKEEK